MLGDADGRGIARGAGSYGARRTGVYQRKRQLLVMSPMRRRR
jgi:hypothetical protein